MDFRFFHDPAFQDAIDHICEERGLVYIDPAIIKELNIICANTLYDLKYFKNLETLNLTAGRYSNLKGLKKCEKLRGLFLFDVDVDDMSVVWSLEQLAGFGMDDCRDIAQVAKLKNLKSLHIIFGDLADSSPLRRLNQIEDLTLQACQLCDISSLSGLKTMRKLDIAMNQICDISPLTSLGMLEAVAIWDNNITDLSPLKNLSGIKRLDVSGNPIRLELCSLNELSCIRTLSELSIRGLPTDKETFKEAINLKKLCLGGEYCEDISFLPRFDALEALNLYGSQVWDISFIYDMPKLKSLWMDNNPLIVDFTPAYSLQNRGVSVYMGGRGENGHLHIDTGNI